MDQILLAILYEKKNKCLTYIIYIVNLCSLTDTQHGG